MTRPDRSRLPLVGGDPAFTFPDIVHHTLPNGLRVRTVEHHNVPVITFVLQVKAGFGLDPASQEGLAGITADMLDEGTGGLSAIDVSDALARIGADFDIDVAPDVTVLSLTTLARLASRGVSLLADLVTSPSLRDADFERVRQLRLDRLLQLKDLPPAVAERAFLRLMYGTHPYGHLSIGSDGALRSLSQADVAAFHRSTYRPDRAILVVAGAMSHNELASVAAQGFGGWQAGAAGDLALPQPDTIDPEMALDTRLAIVPRDGAAQSELRIGHLSARRNSPDYPALLVMNAILGGQFVSRVNLKLREEKGYTYGARTGFDWRLGLAPFSLQASVHTAATADAVRDSLNELEGIRGARPPLDGELSLAKASLTRGYPRGFETAGQVARSVAQLALYGLPDSYFAEFVPRVNTVTGGEVVAAASKYLDPERLTTLIVGDHGAIANSLMGLGLGTPKVLPLVV